MSYTGHHVDERVVILGPARCEADAAVAHHGGRHAVRRGGCHAVTPDGLSVVVGVQVHEAGRDEPAGGVDLAVAVGVDGAHRGDQPAGYRDVPDVRIAAESVDDGAAPNDELICHTPNVR